MDKNDRVLFITGEEDRLAGDYIERLTGDLNPTERAFNLTNFDGESFSEILPSLQTYPVMGDRRIVVAENTDFGDNEELEAYLKDPVATTLAIFRERSVDKRKKNYKLFKKYAKIIEVGRMDLSQATSWVKKEFKDGGKTVDDALAQYVLERSHYLEGKGDAMGLEKTVKQIISYAMDGKIDREAVDAVIPETVEDNVFALIDGVLSGKIKGLSLKLKTLFDKGESPIGLYGLLLYQLRNLLKVRVCFESGANQREIVSRTGLAPFLVKKYLPLARRVDSGRLKKYIMDAAEEDLKLKTGMVDPAFSLEMFLLKLAKK